MNDTDSPSDGRTENNDSETPLQKQDPVSSPLVGMGTVIGIGAGFGLIIGIALDNIALGLAMGAAIGVVLGAAIQSSQTRKDALK